HVQERVSQGTGLVVLRGFRRKNEILSEPRMLFLDQVAPMLAEDLRKLWHERHCALALSFRLANDAAPLRSPNSNEAFLLIEIAPLQRRGFAPSQPGPGQRGSQRVPALLMLPESLQQNRELLRILKQVGVLLGPLIQCGQLDACAWVSTEAEIRA